RMRKCYEILGKKENVEEYVSKGGHDYRPDLRVAIFQFINKHLKQEVGPVKDADFPKIEGKDLRVFPEDKDLPKDQINDRVDEVFVPVAEVKLPAKAGEFKEWKAGLVKRLRETSFRAMPEKVPPVVRGRELSGGTHTASSEEGVDFIVVENMNEGGAVAATLFILNPNEQNSAGTDFFRSTLGGNPLFTYIVAPRGGLQFGWTRKNPPNTVERSFALLGQTADTGRVRDLASVLSNVVQKEDRSPYQIAGRAQSGVIAAYAAMLVPGVNMELVILDPPTSHRDGPHFLNVDRVLDLP